jgi:hypothetical protein
VQVSAIVSRNAAAETSTAWRSLHCAAVTRDSQLHDCNGNVTTSSSNYVSMRYTALSLHVTGTTATPVMQYEATLKLQTDPF